MNTNTSFENISLLYTNGFMYDITYLNKISIIRIFNSKRNDIEEDIVNKLEMVWNYTENNMGCGVWFVALMFDLRNIRRSKYMIDPEIEIEIYINEPKSFKIVSYYMALWLLKHQPTMFVANHTRFVSDIGYYKDCLNMAKMAKERGYSKEQINMILMPMASALMTDEYNIVHACINPSNANQNKKISLASKWAPRQGKAFAEFIPQLKKLCNITGPQSDMKWRKYIQRIIKSGDIKSIPIETHLSDKNYAQIDMSNIPVKAFNLYKNKFLRTPELLDKYMIKSKSDFELFSTKLILKEYFKDDIEYTYKLNNHADIKSKLDLIHDTLYQFIPLIEIIPN